MEQETWRILIVEDDRRLAELTQEYLQSSGGLEVSIESDGACAAERINDERPDLVVLDRDVFDGPPEQIHTARAVLTLVDGEAVHDPEMMLGGARDRGPCARPGPGIGAVPKPAFVRARGGG